METAGTGCCFPPACVCVGTAQLSRTATQKLQQPAPSHTQSHFFFCFSSFKRDNDGLFFFFLLDSQIRTAPNATTMVNSPMVLYRTVRYEQQPRQTNTNLLERYYQSLARTNPRFPASQNQTEIGGKNSTAAQHRTYRNPPRDLPTMLGRRETPTHSRAREGRFGFCENALARRIKQKKRGALNPAKVDYSVTLRAIATGKGFGNGL